MYRFLVALACIATLHALRAQNVPAQTLSNPNVGAIIDMRYVFYTQEAATGFGVDRTDFDFHELELSLDAYLNPYMRGDVTISIEGTEGPVDVEQASMTVLRGLPLSLQLEAGKYLLDFGQINQQHPHQWAWLEFPLMIQTMFGEEGLRTVGARVSTLQALGDNAVTLALNAFSSVAFELGDEGQTAEEESAPPDIMYSGRLSCFRQFSDSWSGESGVSGLYGTYDPAQNLHTRVAGFDLKLRWRPGTYTSFVWILEAMYSDRDVAIEDTSGVAAPAVASVTAPGTFTSMDYQFRKRWDVGGYFDYTEDAVIEGAQSTAWGLFFGFMPSEETARFSVVYRNEVSDLNDFTDNQLTLQVLWALGPHRPHSF